MATRAISCLVANAAGAAARKSPSPGDAAARWCEVQKPLADCNIATRSGKEMSAALQAEAGPYMRDLFLHDLVGRVASIRKMKAEFRKFTVSIFY